MKMSARLMLTIGVFVFSVVDLRAQDEDIIKVVASGTSAVVLKKYPPNYPPKALREGIEGWVVLNFVVREDGTTDKIVVKDASIDNYFERYAINAVSRWIYEPATLNGKPIADGNRSARTTFIIRNQGKGVTRKFLSKYKEAQKAIEEGDLPTARTLINELDAYNKRLIAEVFYLDLVESYYWQSMKNNHAALKHVERALVLAKDVASEGAYVRLLRHAVFGNAIAKDYSAALSHYQTFLEEEGEPAPDDPLRGVVAQIRKILEGEKEIVYQGTISTCEYCRPTVTNWRHPLNRNRFSIGQVTGQVSDIEVVCGIHSVLFEYEQDVAWSINQDWGACNVQVSGADGTTFLLIEHPRDT
jgi:TonB family protein